MNRRSLASALCSFATVVGTVGLGGCGSTAAQNRSVAAPAKPVTTGSAASAAGAPEARQLTSAFPDTTEADLSPDGQWIAFQAVPHGETLPQLFIAPVKYDAANTLEGIGHPLRITPRGTRNGDARFSPDGHDLLFTSDARRGTREVSAANSFEPRVEIFRADGWVRRVAAADPRRGVDLTTSALTNNAFYDGESDLSRDGRFVVFASDRAAPPTATDTRPFIDLYLMRADGSGETVPLVIAPGYDSQPRISPDGRRLAWVADRESDGNGEIYVAELIFDSLGRIIGAGDAREITGEGDHRDPTWHPSGQSIAYSSTRTKDPKNSPPGDRDIRSVGTRGENDRVIVSGPTAEERPAYSHDGRHLLFASRRTGDGSRQLYVTRIAP